MGTPATMLGEGRYVCVRTHSLFGWVIRAWTRSPYDHVFVCLGEGRIAEATTRGVRVDSISAYTGLEAVANTAEDMTPDQCAAVAAAAESFAGREYNWADIAVIALRRLGVRWGWLLRLAERRSALICSEVAALSGEAAGLVGWLCGQPDACLVTPAALAQRPGARPVVWD